MLNNNLNNNIYLFQNNKTFGGIFFQIEYVLETKRNIWCAEKKCFKNKVRVSFGLLSEKQIKHNIVFL